MPFTGASGTANTQASKWLVENDPRRIQLHSHLPAFGVAGGFLTYSRVPALVAAPVVDPCAPAKDHSDGAAPVRFGMVEYATRLQVCNADQDVFRDPNLIEEINIITAEVKCWYGYYGRMDVLTGNPVLGGLPDLVAPGRVVDMAGVPLSFPCLSRAFHLVTANSGHPCAIMSNARSRESYENLCRASGFDVPMISWRWYCPATRMWIDGWVPAFNGVPWLINDEMNPGVLPADRRIYFMVLGDDEGKGPTRGLTRLVPAAMVQSPFVLRVTNGVPDFVNQEVNMTKDIWLTMPAGLALGSQGALSMLTNFEHVGECGGA